MPATSKRPQPKNSNASGYLGVTMEETDDENGVKITLVSPKSPAEKAGLKINDVVIAVNGEETLDVETLRSTIGLHKPGDTVTIRLRRISKEGTKEEELKATLEKRPANLANRGDLQNSMGTDRSERRTGFPVTLQHDTDLKASQCGGPLVDLEGRVIGINIARGGRTDTYAIPTEAIKPLLADLLVAKISEQSPAAKAIIQEVKKIEAEIKQANASKAIAEKKLADSKAALDKMQAAEKAAVKEVKDAEEAKVVADKRLTDAKAALEKLQADLKKENAKK
jgi:serine protease Do